MKKVIDAKWQQVARFARGMVAGSQTMWTLKLECGHEVTRYRRNGRGETPKRAECRKCDGAEVQP